MKPEFKEAFEKYVAGCEKVYDVYHKANGFSESNRNLLEYKQGRRYVKVISLLSGGSQRSVHSFIDMKEGASYGDVLKPAGWSKPAKHARGNIFDKNDGLGMMTAHGPQYLR